MVKGKQAKTSEKEKPPEVIPDEVVTLPPLISNITITINCCEHLKPIYSATDVIIKAQYMKSDPWESPRIPVTDADYLEIEKDFTLSTNLNSKVDMDNLISYPVNFTLTEYPGIMDPEIYAQLNVQNVPEVVEEPVITCVESAANLSDLLQDQKIDRTTLLKDVKKKGKGKDDKKGKDKKGKDKKGSKDKRGSKGSKKSSKSGSSKDTALLKPPSGPKEVGYGCLDLLPLFLGNNEFSEKLILRQPDDVHDDSMVPKDCLPTLTVTVTVDSPWYSEEKKTNVLNLTLEAAYNLPSIIMTNMDYKICTHVMREEKLEPFVSIGGKVSNVLDRERRKYWPPISAEDTYLEPTKYRIDRECRSIRNRMDIDLEEYLNKDVPKIEWNILKRFFLKTDGTNLFGEYVKRFRKIGLEFLITPKAEPPKTASEKPGKKGGKDKGKDKGKGSVTVEAQDNFSEYFHFMTFIDVSSLLYPGVNKVRVVCPFRTYQRPEFMSGASINDSFFIPRPPEVPPTPVVFKGGKGKGGGSSKGSSKKSGSKKSGSKKGGGGDAPPEKTNLNKLLPPPPPPPPEPSLPVYDDLGRQSFIIIEVELLKPIFLPRNVEDLSNKLQEIVPQRPSKPKCAVDSIISEEIYKENIKEMIENLSCDYQNYLIEKENCECPPEDSEQNSFMNYLNKVGLYQVYFKSITKSTSLIVKNKFPFRGDTTFGNKYYLNHISTVYSYLITEMNDVINNVVTYDVNKEYKPIKKDLNRLLYYAKEATELKAFPLARNYYLKRICSGERNPKCWLDFAIYNLQMEDERQAFECVQEALGVDPDHRYSLMFYGYLLSKRGLSEQAETCFLFAIAGNLRWLEGWGAVHIFYVSISNQEGADFCLEMAKKYIETDRTDYTCDPEEDLSWTVSICPNTIFFRTACLFIKMRAYEFAEIALSYEVNKNAGLCHYYLAVMTYLQSNYSHALSHLEIARDLYGLNYAVLGLEGHCYLQQKEFEKANEDYQRVLQLFNRPEDVHLIYINSSLAYKAVGDDVSALKMILLPCKLSPTPYTWFMAGLHYFHKYDFLSAEECFTQANIYDNDLAEIWAYLTLVNLHLGRFIEADLCYTQTIKNELLDENLLENVRKALKSVQ